MFVRFERDSGMVPIKTWLPSQEYIDDMCERQVANISRLPFAFHHVALMPDCHGGFGMPVGGVLATENVIIPNAVGVDIGCGMSFISTNIPVSLIREAETGQGNLIQAIIGCIMRNIPVGFAHQKDAQQCVAIDYFIDNDGSSYCIENELVDELEKGYYQIGTLGGGNHFIELQEDENGLLGLMLHSGSRNFGYKVCKFFNNKAKELNTKWYSNIPVEYDLAFLPTDTLEGKQYIAWMQLAMEFAAENRAAMMNKVKEIVFNHIEKYTDFSGIELGDEINCHHNYASLENHFGKNVWVHRKGAIMVRSEVKGIIPGAMGSYSYIVEGLGNPNSFCSASHGAGRSSSRTKARETYSVEQVMLDLREQGVFLGKQNKKDIAEECRMAYKDVEFVIEQEKDLVTPIKKLKTIGVVKG
jgi:tRNA-splicing ligase RtcB